MSSMVSPIPITLRITILIFLRGNRRDGVGVVFNSESCFFHGLYHQDVADDSHGGGRSRRRHAQYTYFLRFPGAEAYIGFVCQGAVGVSGDDDKLQLRVQVMCQLCQLHDFASFARIGDK